MRVSAIVLAYGAEPWLESCVRSLGESTGVDVDIVLVDNGCTIPGLVEELERTTPRIEVVRPVENLGYAGGCNAGAAVAVGDVLAFINADVVVHADALAALTKTLHDPAVGLVTASVRLADDPDLVNAAGNPLTILGLSWAGHFGEPASDHASRRRAAIVSGATFACRRDTWDLLGGFDPLHFAYHEDTDLSVRCWQRGLEVVFEPDAVVVHRYEFSRNPRKYYLLERNRLLNLLTLWELRTLLVLLPVLVPFELSVLLLSAKHGWRHEKVDGYRWLWRHRHEVRARRSLIQSQRTVPDSVVVRLLTPAINAVNAPPLPPAWMRAVNVVLHGYWAVAERLL
jgi:GT2 family glycosyltransferase